MTYADFCLLDLPITHNLERFDDLLEQYSVGSHNPSGELEQPAAIAQHPYDWFEPFRDMELGFLPAKLAIARRALSLVNEVTVPPGTIMTVQSLQLPADVIGDFRYTEETAATPQVSATDFVSKVRDDRRKMGLIDSNPPTYSAVGLSDHSKDFYEQFGTQFQATHLDESRDCVQISHIASNTLTTVGPKGIVRLVAQNLQTKSNEKTMNPDEAIFIYEKAWPMSSVHDLADRGKIIRFLGIDLHSVTFDKHALAHFTHAKKDELKRVVAAERYFT